MSTVLLSSSYFGTGFVWEAAGIFAVGILGCLWMASIALLVTGWSWLKFRPRSPWSSKLLKTSRAAAMFVFPFYVLIGAGMVWLYLSRPSETGRDILDVSLYGIGLPLSSLVLIVVSWLTLRNLQSKMTVQSKVG